MLPSQSFLLCSLGLGLLISAFSNSQTQAIQFAVFFLLPVFPLSAALLLPRADLPLNIFEPRYLAMVDAAFAGNRVMGMVQPDEESQDGPGGPALSRRDLHPPPRAA